MAYPYGLSGGNDLDSQAFLHPQSLLPTFYSQSKSGDTDLHQSMASRRLSQEETLEPAYPAYPQTREEISVLL